MNDTYQIQEQEIQISKKEYKELRDKLIVAKNNLKKSKKDIKLINDIQILTVKTATALYKLKHKHSMLEILKRPVTQVI